MFKYIFLLCLSILICSTVYAVRSKEIQEYTMHLDKTRSYKVLIDDITRKMNSVKSNDDKAALYTVRSSVHWDNNNLDKCIDDLKMASKLAEDINIKTAALNMLETMPVLYKYKDINLNNYQDKIANIKDDDDIVAGVLFNPLLESRDFSVTRKIFDTYKDLNKSKGSALDNDFLNIYLIKLLAHHSFGPTEPIEGLEVIKYADSLNNDTPKYKLLKSEIYFNNSMLDETLNHIDAVSEEEQNNMPEFYYFYGMALAQMERFDEAKPYFEKSIDHTKIFDGGGSNNGHYQDAVNMLKSYDDFEKDNKNNTEPAENSKKKL